MSTSNAASPTETTEKGLPGTPGTLNVFLHGLFTIVVSDQEITVYIPNMGSEHTYKAGNWLAEAALNPGDFKLEGVSAGDVKQRFCPKQNVVLRNARATDPVRSDRVYATLHLPYPPLSIKSLGRLVVPEGGIGGASKDLLYPGADKRSATVQILTYKFSSDANLRLGNHPWEPLLDEGFVNLHIFSESEQSDKETHIRQAFQLSASLLAGVDLTLLKPTEPADLQAEEAEIPEGVHQLEVQGLVMRNFWLGVLGRAIKEHRDLNAFWDSPAAFADAEACTGGLISQSGDD